MEISVFNRHTLRDDPIGSTHIDLEDRWRSKHRATVGIANEFSRFVKLCAVFIDDLLVIEILNLCSIGYNKWRDSQSPKQILQDLCRKYDVRLPKFKGPSIEVDGVILEDETEIATGKER